MDCNREIVHISHSQTLNSTCDRGQYPEARLSGQRSPFQFVHVGLHTFPPSSRSVDETVHRFSQSHTLTMLQSQCLCQFCDRFAVQFLISHWSLQEGRFASPLKTFILKDPATVRNSYRPLLETVGDAVGLAPNFGSVNPCITKRAFSESSDFLVMTKRIRINSCIAVQIS